MLDERSVNGLRSEALRSAEQAAKPLRAPQSAEQRRRWAEKNRERRERMNSGSRSYYGGVTKECLESNDRFGFLPESLKGIKVGARILLGDELLGKK